VTDRHLDPEHEGGPENGFQRAPAPPSGSKSRFGCLAATFVFLACAIFGFAVAASIRGNDDDAKQFTLDEGTQDGVSYKLVGEIDEQGERCLFLIRQGNVNTGGCDTTANEGLLGDRSIIFGQVPARAVSVRIPLSTGDLESADVEEKDGFRWYSIVVPSEVDLEDQPAFADADGRSV